MLNYFYQLKKYIDDAQSILLVTHPHPDGDAVGSTTAMSEHLACLGKKCRAYCSDPVPKKFLAIPRAEEIIYKSRYLGTEPPDLVILLDFFGLERSDISEWVARFPRSRIKIVILDHHVVTRKLDADMSIIHPEYSSTAELLFYFFKHTKYPINRSIAHCLLLGILTDTEHFSNQAARQETLAAAHELIRRGARFKQLTNIAYARSLLDLQMTGHALHRVMNNTEFGLVSTVIHERRESISSTVNAVELEGLTNFLKRVSARTVMVLKEKNGMVKVSLRSVSEDVDVALLARVCGGGGHQLAAGFSVPGRLVKKAGGGWRVV